MSLYFLRRWPVCLVLTRLPRDSLDSLGRTWNERRTSGLSGFSDALCQGIEHHCLSPALSPPTPIEQHLDWLTLCRTHMQNHPPGTLKPDGHVSLGNQDQEERFQAQLLWTPPPFCRFTCNQRGFLHICSIHLSGKELHISLLATAGRSFGVSFAIVSSRGIPKPGVEPPISFFCKNGNSPTDAAPWEHSGIQIFIYLHNKVINNS